MSDLRCPSCRQVYTVHDRDGTCPRWALSSFASSGTRVSIRVGTRRWLGSEDHVFAYFADGIAGEMIDAWDLTDDRVESVPLITLKDEYRWTRPGKRDEIDRALEELRLTLGKVTHVKRIGL